LFGVGEKPGGRLMVMMVGRIAMAGTRRRMGVLYCSEQVHGSHRSLIFCQCWSRLK
jgi:hypothetical protein